MSDVNAVLPLAKVPNYTEPRTTAWNTTFAQLIERFKIKPTPSSIKEGPGFLIGACTYRKNENLPKGYIGVIDADATLDSEGHVSTGAPPPEEVHAALCQMQLTHVIYTTFSHGPKGNRYRIIFPMQSDNTGVELLAALTYIVHRLRHEFSIPLYLTPESHRFAQAWQLPRISDDYSPYESYSYVGWEIDPKYAAALYGLYDVVDQGGVKTFVRSQRMSIPTPTRVSHADDSDDEETRPSIIKMFNRTVSTLSLLTSYGYTFASQCTVIGQNGQAEVAYRFLKPNSTGNDPGVIAFLDSSKDALMYDGNQNYRVYSHHANDPLCNGHSHDAFSCMMTVEGLAASSALILAARVVQASVVKHLSEQYPSVVDRNFRVYNRCFEGSQVYYTSMDWNAFQMCTCNREPVPTVERGPTGEKVVKFVPVPDFWKNCRERKVYSDIVFMPYPASECLTSSASRQEQFGFHYEDNGTLKFNTFTGWAEKPRKGNWELLKAHLFNSICGGSEAQFEYLMDWFSHLYCRPTEKPGVALVIKGGKGWGKSIVFQALAKAIGRSARILGSQDKLVGKFNSHLSESLYLVAEEAYFCGNPRDAAHLKHMITDSDTTTEAKGKDSRSSRNFCRFVMISNDDLVVDASSDERRYFVPSVTDWSYRQDIVNGVKGNFFPRLQHEMANGGIAAFMYDAIQRDATRIKVVNVPETEGLTNQRILALKSEDSWMYRVLHSAEIKTVDKRYVWTEKGLQVPEEELYGCIAENLTSYEKSRNYATKILIHLKTVFGEKLLQHQNGKFVFGHIEDCRKRFIEYHKLPKETFNGAVTPLGCAVAPPGSVVSLEPLSNVVAIDIRQASKT